MVCRSISSLLLTESVLLPPCKYLQKRQLRRNLALLEMMTLRSCIWMTQWRYQHHPPPFGTVQKRRSWSSVSPTKQEIAISPIKTPEGTVPIPDVAPIPECPIVGIVVPMEVDDSFKKPEEPVPSTVGSTSSSTAKTKDLGARPKEHPAGKKRAADRSSSSSARKSSKDNHHPSSSSHTSRREDRDRPHSHTSRCEEKNQQHYSAPRTSRREEKDNQNDSGSRTSRREEKYNPSYPGSRTSSRSSENGSRKVSQPESLTIVSRNSRDSKVSLKHQEHRSRSREMYVGSYPNKNSTEVKVSPVYANN